MSTRARRAARGLGRLDRRLLAAAVARRSPAGDTLMTGASTAANHSVLWLGVAAGLAATGRRRPRTAAASGLLGIGIAATLVNGPLKFAWRRDRPPSAGPLPLLPLPRTFSFPSGHSASALAFGTGVSLALPAAAPAVLPAAATVAYSRVYTGVHYPSDVAVGAAIGAGSGVVAAAVVRRLRARSVYRPAATVLARSVPRRAVLVTSKDAGSADGFELARRELVRAGVEIVREVPVADVAGLAGELADEVAGDELPLVIAAGGDGTVCAAANVAHDAGALLAILPLGTSNDVARSLGVPPDPCEAARVITAGRAAAVDAGRVRIGDEPPRLFLNAVTAGLNVHFAREATDPSLRDRFGAFTYPVAAARAVRSAEPFECVIDQNGDARTYRAVHLSISNAPVFGGLLGMRVPGASITDGLLDVIVVERLSLFRTALAAAGNAVGRHHPVHRVHTLRVRSLRVRAGDCEELAMDGEMIGTLPAEFAALPGALHVVLRVDTDS